VQTEPELENLTFCMGEKSVPPDWTQPKAELGVEEQMFHPMREA
jgi:hypothetical protein